jgi:hypothetical protein
MIIDATRTSDGLPVALKRVRAEHIANEVNNARLLQVFAPSAVNHCVPILDILPVPREREDSSPIGEVILVMPLLKTFDEPKFKTYGEAIAFFSQIFEVCP